MNNIGPGSRTSSTEPLQASFDNNTAKMLPPGPSHQYHRRTQPGEPMYQQPNRQIHHHSSYGYNSQPTRARPVPSWSTAPPPLPQINDPMHTVRRNVMSPPQRPISNTTYVKRGHTNNQPIQDGPDVNDPYANSKQTDQYLDGMWTSINDVMMKEPNENQTETIEPNEQNLENIQNRQHWSPPGSIENNRGRF